MDKEQQHAFDLSEARDAQRIADKNYGAASEGSVQEALWHQNMTLGLIAAQLVEMNQHLGRIAQRLDIASLS